jgi:hypothetical protein
MEHGRENGSPIEKVKARVEVEFEIHQVFTPDAALALLTAVYFEHEFASPIETMSEFKEAGFGLCLSSLGSYTPTLAGSFFSFSKSIFLCQEK